MTNRKHETLKKAWRQLLEDERIGGGPVWPWDPGTMEPMLANPYQSLTHWFRGQTHAHTNYDPSGWEIGDDGQQSPTEVEDAYLRAGYDFLCVTGHNFVTPDAGTGILTIPSLEDGRGCRHHLVCLNVDEDPPGDNCDCGDIQKRIDFVRDRGGLAVIAHPTSSHEGHWYHLGCGEGWLFEEVLRADRVSGIEIFNGDGGRDSLDWWDRALCSGRRLYGFGGDDCHDVADNPKFNRAWIMVNSGLDKTQAGDAELSRDLLHNIEVGKFYTVVRSPTHTPDRIGSETGTYPGPTFTISIEGLRVNVTTDEQALVHFITGRADDYTSLFRWPVLAGYPAPEQPASYTLNGTEDWMRLEINVVHDGELYRAYTQPMYRWTKID